MSTAAIAGSVQEYVANIEFSLNFEEPKKLTTKVRVGDVVFFDGVTAKHVNKITGEEKTGKAVPLNAAIQNNWLSLNVEGTAVGPINVRTDKIREVIYKEPDYDPLKGGSFDEYLKDSKDITVAESSKVIKEDDLIVKKADFNGKTPAVKSGKMEVVDDQVDVKSVRTTVANSTSVAASKSRATAKVTQADDGQAGHVFIKGKKAEVQPVKNKNTFTVDKYTPQIQEGASLEEVKKATVQFDGAQDAKVIKKIGSKMPSEPTEVEGIVLKKTDFSSKPSQGSTPVADLSGVKTQEEVDEIEKNLEKKATPKVEKKNYMDMLPEDWSTLHWVRKERFIMAITDIEFLKFIMKVESIKAVHAACRKRMTELAKIQG